MKSPEGFYLQKHVVFICSPLNHIDRREFHQNSHQELPMDTAAILVSSPRCSAVSVVSVETNPPGPGVTGATGAVAIAFRFISTAAEVYKCSFPESI